jgi:hypothetical protein
MVIIRRLGEINCAKVITEDNPSPPGRIHARPGPDRHRLQSPLEIGEIHSTGRSYPRHPAPQPDAF